MLLGEFLDRLLLQGEELLPVVEIRGLGLGEEVAGERAGIPRQREDCGGNRRFPVEQHAADVLSVDVGAVQDHPEDRVLLLRSEEHTSELQSLMRNSYAVFCLKKKKILQIRMYHHSNQRTLRRTN